jgi:DNA-damage-inducible protein J
MINIEMTNVQTRLPLHIKNQAEEIFEQMGMSLNDGIRIYVSQVINERAMPFKPTIRPEIPNNDTLAAIQNVEKGHVVQTNWKDMRKMMGLKNA